MGLLVQFYGFSPFFSLIYFLIVISGGGPCVPDCFWLGFLDPLSLLFWTYVVAFRSFFGGSTCPWGLVAFVWVIPVEGELGIQTFMFVVCPGVEELVVIIYRDS